ncbi:TPA: hypothetical protein O8L60_000093 [Enterobacter cloacae]|nr:hypothetical protein [Enterobacter cloacae]
MERNMDESRKQFEAEIEHSYGEDFLVVNDDGDYANWITADLWEFWVKSRAAIEIEPISHYQAVNAIPSSETSIIDAVKIGYLLCAEAAGIKVKE